MARPRKEERLQKVIGVRLDTQHMQILEKLATRQFRPVANMAAYLLTAALEAHTEPQDSKPSNGHEYRAPKVRATT